MTSLRAERLPPQRTCCRRPARYDRNQASAELSTPKVTCSLSSRIPCFVLSDFSCWISGYSAFIPLLKTNAARDLSWTRYAGSLTPWLGPHGEESSAYIK